MSTPSPPLRGEGGAERRVGPFGAEPWLKGSLSWQFVAYADEGRSIIRLVERDGWFQVVTRGSHRQFKHTAKPGRVTIAGKLSEDLSPAMESSILKQAGLNKGH